MKLFYNTALILLLFPIAVSAYTSPKGKYTKEKKIEKTFKVQSDAELKINNKYGNVDIISWNENRIEIVVTITTSGNNEESVQKQLNDITVNFSDTKSLVTATTVIPNKNTGWNLWGKSNNVSMEINYLIKMPETNHLDLTNNYGAVSINKLKGNTKINCDYGKLIIGELLGKQNQLNFNYTNNSTISTVQNASIHADYSGFKLDRAKIVTFSGDYTKAEFGELNDINFDCDYGKLTIAKANNISGKGNYITKEFGKIENSLNLKTRYGKIAINRLEKNFKEVTIDAKYTSINISFDRLANFDFSSYTSYAGVKGIDNLTIQTRIDTNSKREFEGFYNTKDSGNTITIRSDYGGVTLTKF